MPEIRVGILALQGAVGLHADLVARLGARPVEVRTPGDLEGIDALILPGGESTTMSNLLERNRLFDPIAQRLAQRLPVFGTCAGMILLATTVLDGRADQRSFGVIDITVRRNAFGRQVDSFEADLDVAGLSGDLSSGELSSGGLPSNNLSGNGRSADGRREVREPDGPHRPMHAVFIRAPFIEAVASGVEVLATVDGHPVCARQGTVLVTAFHPELSGDARLHRSLLNMIPAVRS